MRRFAAVLLTSIALATLAGPWALYGLGLYAVAGKPALPDVIAPREAQLLVWSQARGTGEPEVVAANPYSYLPLSFARGPHRPSLLLAWRVATDHYEEHSRYRGGLWRQVSCGALVIWITHAWSPEQLLSKVVELRAKKSAA